MHRGFIGIWIIFLINILFQTSCDQSGDSTFRADIARSNADSTSEKHEDNSPEIQTPTSSEKTNIPAEKHIESEDRLELKDNRLALFASNLSLSVNPMPMLSSVHSINTGKDASEWEEISFQQKIPKIEFIKSAKIQFHFSGNSNWDGSTNLPCENGKYFMYYIKTSYSIDGGQTYSDSISNGNLVSNGGGFLWHDTDKISVNVGDKVIVKIFRKIEEYSSTSDEACIGSSRTLGTFSVSISNATEGFPIKEPEGYKFDESLEHKFFSSSANIHIDSPEASVENNPIENFPGTKWFEIISERRPETIKANSSPIRLKIDFSGLVSADVSGCNAPAYTLPHEFFLWLHPGVSYKKSNSLDEEFISLGGGNLSKGSMPFTASGIVDLKIGESISIEAPKVRVAISFGFPEYCFKNLEISEARLSVNVYPVIQ